MSPDRLVASMEKLRCYEALLHKWQRAVNLVGPATLAESWERHFLDSAQLSPFIPDEAKTLYDLGSGAGFPGLVLAMMHPELAVTLVESDEKKCAFLAAVSRESEVPVTVKAMRIEKAAESLPPPDVVTARALAPLEKLLEYIYPWVQVNPALICVFPKGQMAAAEIEAARANWGFDSRETVSQTDPAGRILIIKDIDRLDESRA